MSRNIGSTFATCNASRNVARIASRFSNKNRRRGVVLYYTTVVMVLLCGFCSFAVDLGRVQIAKTELRRAADSAARAAAAELPDLNSAISFAASYANKNSADGSAIALDANKDIEFGKWDTKAAKGAEWTKLTGFAAQNANCVHVTLRRSAQRGTAVPLLFAKVLGVNSCDVTGESYVMLVPGVNVDQYVPATANPFLSGMPAGSIASRNNPHNSPDFAGTASNPKQSPLGVAMTISGGDELNFDSISGDARHDPDLAYFSPDGELADIGHNINNSNGSSAYNNVYTNENGIADMKAPINALVGLFLDDSSPNTTSAPSNLDFSSSASREFTELKPKLKQIFFIGDGKNGQGARQKFVAPAGATRLYLATWDFYEWNNNAGSRNIKVKRPQRIITVK